MRNKNCTKVSKYFSACFLPFAFKAFKLVFARAKIKKLNVILKLNLQRQ